MSGVLAVWTLYAVAKAIVFTGDWTSSELRWLATASRHANQSCRLLSLTAVRDGMNRTEAAGIQAEARNGPKN